MYPAENGDAFLICSSDTNILIDGGYAKTFDKHIKQDLDNLASKGNILDLVIVTHIDADHIGGIIRLLLLNESKILSKVISIKKVWHNSLRSLSLPNSSEISQESLEILKSFIRRGHPKNLIAETEQVEEISARQGSTLATLINKGRYCWNEKHGLKNICVEENSYTSLPNGSIKVITPTKLRLQELLHSWKKELKRYGLTESVTSNTIVDDAFELSLEHRQEENTKLPELTSSGQNIKLEDIYSPDESKTNGSSIATIIELDGVRVLMLADAWAEDIIVELNAMKAQGDNLEFDAIKISHHGSIHNTSPELLKLIDAPAFFISTNGSGNHNHPDLEPLCAIVDREANFMRTIYFNYSTSASRKLKNYQTTTGATFTVVENATNWINIKKD
nr:AVAST type 1 anti-phage system MBL fold metallo-hydrolase Avs1a [Pseudoalteromonas sp. Z1A2]|tara:strand:- start:6573 stop:7745 length:1173 start_codon:yes stop_codon:yes gene_type:complete